MKKIILILIVAAVLWGGYSAFQKKGDVKVVENRGETSVAEVSPSSGNYIDKKGRFSFVYPEGFKVSLLSESADVEIVTLNKPSTDIGLQIKITDAKETVVISEEKIIVDIPDMVVSDPVPVVFGAGKGLMFASDNEDFGGKSREVWFSKGNFVYQVSAKMEYDNLVKTVLNSWKFKDLNI